MIYGRFGGQVTMVRHAVLGDVKGLDGRKPDKHDRRNIEHHGYVVVKDEDGKERLYAFGYLRADDGFAEIMRELRAVCGCEVACEATR